MIGFIRKSMVAAAIVAPFVLVAPTTAYAHGPDVVAGLGTGTIDPGIPCTGCTVHAEFTGGGVGVDATGLGTCTFDGTSTGETLAAGSGDGTISCTGAAEVAGSVHYDRSGPLVTVSGRVLVNGTAPHDLTCLLAFIPLDATASQFVLVGGCLGLASA